MGSREGFTMKNLMVCTVPRIVRLIKCRKLRCAGHLDRMDRSTFKILAGKPAGKRPLESPRRR